MTIKAIAMGSLLATTSCNVEPVAGPEAIMGARWASIPSNCPLSWYEFSESAITGYQAGSRITELRVKDVASGTPYGEGATFRIAVSSEEAAQTITPKDTSDIEFGFALDGDKLSLVSQTSGGSTIRPRPDGSLAKTFELTRCGN